MTYIKHFNEQSTDYRHFRPSYPTELFEYLYTLINTFDLAVDCATGNGQAAIPLATHFKNVIGLDIAQEQLNNAEKKANIEYRCSDVEHTGIPDHSVDLIVVAQALHWFHLYDFYHEVKRISKQTGIIAAWAYALGNITPSIDATVAKLYSDLGNGYWPKERHYIEEGYRTIPFPFKKITAPSFSIEKSINFEELIGYLNTWSAVKEFKKQNHKNPIDEIYADLEKTWGKPDSKYTMRWPLHLLVGHVF